MKVWDALGGREVNSLQHADQDVLVTSCAFSPDAKRVVAGQSNCNITVYDTVYGTELASMKGHTRVVNAVVFSPDGKYVLSCSDDRSLKVIISLHPRLFFSFLSQHLYKQTLITSRCSCGTLRAARRCALTPATKTP